MDFAVGVGVADVEPVAFIEYDSTELLLFDKIDKGRYDRGDLLIRDELEDLRLDAVDAGELMKSRYILIAAGNSFFLKELTYHQDRCIYMVKIHFY